MAASIVVMGVAGAGKSTVGPALAERLGIPYVDADDLHSDANVVKMAAGLPLDDADRAPWLATVGRWLADHSGGGVAACSALRRKYRDIIREAAPSATFLCLDADPDLARSRVGRRPDHFMPASLVASQFATLEPLGADEMGLTVDAGRDVDDIVDTFLGHLTGRG